MKASELINRLGQYKNPEKAAILQRFFKTGPGEYGEGDVFWGITVPQTRDTAKLFKGMPFAELTELLDHPVHEVRLAAGIILVETYKKSPVSMKEQIYDFYLKHANRFNNWDLVDLTAHHIVGDWLKNRDRKPLYDLAISTNIWEQRIAIISTFAFIRCGDFQDSLEISKHLMYSKHDLIQKATGWMLREIGKRQFLIEKEFLLENERYKTLPRTLLRYAIEKFPESERQFFLKK